MKLMASGVTRSAASTRSPSFSRSSSSTRMTMRPLRTWSMASSTRSSRSVCKAVLLEKLEGEAACAGGVARACDRHGRHRGEQPLYILGEHVDLEVDVRKGRFAIERGVLARVRDERDFELGGGRKLVDGETDAIDRDGALDGEIASQIGWRRNPDLNG